MLARTELPNPVPAEGEVLIRVRAFGLNHAETYFRSGAWGDVAKVTGIECAGIVEGGALPAGTRVVAILGGMGRTRNGSYAELVTVPASNVAPVDVDLPWPVLAAVPEVYATAWSGLRDNLDLRAGQTVLVRGATSALGQAAVSIAADLGATVLATTRNPDRATLLRDRGAADVLIDDSNLAARLQASVDAVLDLVGNSALRDSLACPRRPDLARRVPVLRDGGLPKAPANVEVTGSNQGPTANSSDSARSCPGPAEHRPTARTRSSAGRTAPTAALAPAGHYPRSEPAAGLAVRQPWAPGMSVAE